MDIAPEIATYLEFQTWKMKGVKELVTVDTLVLDNSSQFFKETHTFAIWI